MRIVVAAGAAIGRLGTGKVDGSAAAQAGPSLRNLTPRKRTVKNGLAFAAGLPHKTLRAAESHQRTQPFDERRTDPSHVAHRLDRSERSERVPIRNDPLRQRRSDPGKCLDFDLRRSIDIDRIGDCRRADGSGLTSDRFPPARLPRRAARGIHASELTIVRGRFRRRRVRLARAPHADAHPRNRDERQEPKRLPFVRSRHAGVCARPAPVAASKARVAGQDAARYFRSVTSVSATSPTICRLRALTFSIVSPCV